MIAVSDVQGHCDRVLDAVGDQRVGLADVEADVEDQPLADLPLCGRDAVVRVEREPDDLDGDADLGALVVLVVAAGEVLVLVLVGIRVLRSHPAAT